MDIRKRRPTYKKKQMIIGGDRTENEGREPRAGASEREREKMKEKLI